MKVNLTRQQVRGIDELAAEIYGIPTIVLMENAGRNAAEFILQRCSKHLEQVLILVGPGNNGGDGLVVARHLHNRDIEVSLLLCCDPLRLRGDAATNYQIAHKMSLTMRHWNDGDRIEGSLIVDGLLGTGLSRPIEGLAARAIEAVNRSGAPVVALDVPSGLDVDTGTPLGVAIRADFTVTFVAEKTGYAHPSARTFLGQVHVAEIGIPKQLVRHVLSGE